MKDYIIEYKINFSDGIIAEEQTINVQANSKEEAESIGKQALDEIEEGFNRNCDGNYVTFIRCVQANEFSYISSAKEDVGIYKDAGYIDVIAFKNFL